METLYKILVGVLLGLSLTFLGLWLFEKRSHNTDVKELNLRIAICENAPVRVDTVIKDKIVQVEKWHKVPPVTKVDTVYISGKMAVVNTYSDTLITKDFDLAYNAKTIGILKEVNFPYYKLHTPEIYITKTVLRDTCINKPPKYIPKNHWIIEGALSGSNIKSFPNVDLGASYSIKDRFKLYLGGEYNFYHSEPYIKVGVGVYLN